MKTRLKTISAWLITLSIAFLPTSVFAVESNTEDTYITDNTITFLTESALADNDELFSDYVNRLFYPDRSISLFGTSARARLNTHGKVLYDFLKTKIENVAAGELASTTFELDTAVLAQNGVKLTWTNTELGVDSITDFQAVMVNFYDQFAMDKVMDALLHDCPYNLYWYDKTAGVAYSAGVSYGGYGSIISQATIVNPKIAFRVAAAYQPASGYDASAPAVDTAKTSAATLAMTNAQAIVNRYAALSDYDKLVAYRDEICDLVSYNHDAASESYTGGYGDPWQIVYVFDGDKQTNVVCEGYAKAFQYLCDLSTFDNAVCYTVIGQMVGGTGAGGHMWNIVTMENGKNYLVDITNSDTGTVGQNGGLFLAGTTGSVTDGYQFTINTSARILFVYDPTESIAMWGEDADSILNLAESDYTPKTSAEQISVLGALANTLAVTKIDTGTAIFLQIKPTGSNALPETALYTAIYDAHGKLSHIASTPCEHINGKITLTVPKPTTSANETYKIMLWTKNQVPIVAAM